MKSIFTAAPGYASIPAPVNDAITLMDDDAQSVAHLRALNEEREKNAIEAATRRPRVPMESFKLHSLAAAARLLGKPLTQPQTDEVLKASSARQRELTAYEIAALHLEVCG
jgi:hypothetical protein